MISFLIRLCKILLVLCLPFIALIRGSVFFHERYDIGAYPSLAGGAAITVVILVVYMTFFYERATNRVGGRRAFKTRGIFSMALIGGFMIQGIFFMSNKNMKTSEVSQEIRDLHPISRLAVSTVIFLDRDLLITDASRIPEDYRRLGLPSKSSSLHYRQKDGYAYALDLRTNARSEFRNVLLQNYFRIMGFRTLRHGGTGDHLHVSIYCHYLPKSL